MFTKLPLSRQKNGQYVKQMRNLLIQILREHRVRIMLSSTNTLQVSYFVQLPQSKFPDYTNSPTFPWLLDISLTLAKFPDISRNSRKVTTLCLAYWISTTDAEEIVINNNNNNNNNNNHTLLGNEVDIGVQLARPEQVSNLHAAVEGRVEYAQSSAAANTRVEHGRLHVRSFRLRQFVVVFYLDRQRGVAAQCGNLDVGRIRHVEVAEKVDGADPYAKKNIHSRAI